MKKTSKFMTVARFVAAGLAVLSPATKASEAVVVEQTRTVDANKEAVVKNERKGLGITTNDITGGLQFDMPRMMVNPNPIFIPKYHTKMTYREQSRRAVARRKAK